MVVPSGEKVKAGMVCLQGKSCVIHTYERFRGEVLTMAIEIFVPLLLCKSEMCLLIVSGSLQIRHSLESDEGKYECVAENSIGVAYSYGANLYVRGTHCRFKKFEVRRPSCSEDIAHLLCEH